MTIENRPIWRGFASDNYAGVHPRIFEIMQSVNEGHEIAYGDDTITAELSRVFKQHFGSQSEVFPVFNGTGANVTALQSVVKRWESVICADTAHIHSDEGGAPEKMAGLKLFTLPTPDGKLTEALVEPILQGIKAKGVHRPQVAAISISNTTELGTLYNVAEVRALADFAHSHGFLLHMDGARLANAAAALGTGFKEFTTDAGVDLVSFGGTKIGALAAEAVVVLNDAAVSATVPHLRKTSMQLPSKMRFFSAQLIGLLENDLALGNARHANAMAKRLDAGVRDLAERSSGRVSVPNPTEANACLPILPFEIITELQKNYRFYIWDHSTGQVRWMCAWDTTQEDVDGLLAALQGALGL